MTGDVDAAAERDLMHRSDPARAASSGSTLISIPGFDQGADFVAHGIHCHKQNVCDLFLEIETW